MRMGSHRFNRWLTTGQLSVRLPGPEGSRHTSVDPMGKECLRTAADDETDGHFKYDAPV
jgi:hypothetical protein